MFLFVYVCVSVCVVCLFVLLCIYIILSEKVNDFASSSIFEVDQSHKELLICPRHRDDFGTRWLCNKKNCSCPSDWAPHLFLWGHVSIHQNSILTATLIRDSIRIGEEKTTLINKAKIFYVQKLTEGTSIQPQMVSSTLLMSSSTKLSESWALRASKKSTHFNENQKNFLDEKFKLGQETGYKEDPSQVASDMHRVDLLLVSFITTADKVVFLEVSSKDQTSGIGSKDRFISH